MQSDRVLGANPENGKQIVVKDGRFGPYVTELEPEAEAAEASVDPSTGEVVEAPKPKRGAKKAAAGQAAHGVALQEHAGRGDRPAHGAAAARPAQAWWASTPSPARRSPPRTAATAPTSRRPPTPARCRARTPIFDIDLPGALELFAQPKYGARRASSALKEFDNDPVSGKPIKVKDGRFGPYVTDGTTNATIPRAESVEEITFERAVELLQIKRDKGPAAPKAKRTTTRTTTAKKAPARKPAAKKSTA